MHLVSGLWSWWDFGEFVVCVAKEVSPQDMDTPVSLDL